MKGKEDQGLVACNARIVIVSRSIVALLRMSLGDGGGRVQAAAVASDNALPFLILYSLLILVDAGDAHSMSSRISNEREATRIRTPIKNAADTIACRAAVCA